MDEARREIERIATTLVDAVLQVHRELGPGLLSSAYQACLARALSKRGIPVECEVALPVRFGGATIAVGYRIDMVVAGLILVENKTVASLLPVHRAQLLTYLKLSDRRLGFLINWNVTRIRDGIRRLVNRL